MIDLILRHPSGTAALVAWGKTHPPANPLIVEVETEQGTINVFREGFQYSLWGNQGQFMTDSVGPTFLPGAVALCRITGSFFNQTKLADQTYDGEGNPQLEQWQRSTVAQYIQTNGSLGSIGSPSIPYYEFDGLQIFRPEDVYAFLAANSLPRHEWLGGNFF